MAAAFVSNYLRQNKLPLNLYLTLVNPHRFRRDSRFVAMTTPIPSPRGYPIIGNLLDLQDEVPLNAIERLLNIYGPIVKFSARGIETVVVGSFELFDELCDETRFFKLVSRKVVQGNGSGKRGLFTSHSEKDEDWGLAHRILMPAFGPLAIEDMFDGISPSRNGKKKKKLLTDNLPL